MTGGKIVSYMTKSHKAHTLRHNWGTFRWHLFGLFLWNGRDLNHAITPKQNKLNKTGERSSKNNNHKEKQNNRPICIWKIAVDDKKNKTKRENREKQITNNAKRTQKKKKEREGESEKGKKKIKSNEKTKRKRAKNLRTNTKVTRTTKKRWKPTNLERIKEAKPKVGAS